MAQLFGLARLGRDAEVRSTAQGDQVASLSLAFTYGKKGADGKRPAQWVEGALWKPAEALVPYLVKGSSIVVVLDDLHIEIFTKRDNTQGHKLVGRVSKLELAGGTTSAPPPAPKPPAPAPKTSSGFDDMDDDIPF